MGVAAAEVEQRTAITVSSCGDGSKHDRMVTGRDELGNNAFDRGEGAGENRCAGLAGCPFNFAETVKARAREPDRELLLVLGEDADRDGGADLQQTARYRPCNQCIRGTAADRAKPT